MRNQVTEPIVAYLLLPYLVPFMFPPGNTQSPILRFLTSGPTLKTSPTPSPPPMAGSLGLIG